MEMKLTIITVNRNNAEGLRKTIQSVLAQSFQDFEYVIVDGNSTDNSVEVIREELMQSGFGKDACLAQKELLKAQRSAITIQWLSEPDTGIYNAMNKGIGMASGDYLLFLNSGDCLYNSGVLEKVQPYLQQDDIVQGYVYKGQVGEKNIDRGYGRSEISFFDAYAGHFLHQASFIRKSLFEQYGLYDESYPVSADTVFFLKVLGFHNTTFRYVDIPIALFELGGVSSYRDEKWIRIRREEDRRIENEILGNRLTQLCKEGQKKVNLYDRLHSSRLLWNCTMFMVRISNLFGKK